MTKAQKKQQHIVWAIKDSVRIHEDDGDKTLGDYTVWTSWIMYIAQCNYTELRVAMDAYRKETGKELRFCDN